MPRGRLITFEGIEGAGKSSCIAAVAESLQQRGMMPVLTREPGGCELAEAVRELLLSRSLPPMANLTELLLMFAARNEHLDRRIRPALDAGQWVLCDRFTDASLAYQGGGRGLPASWIETLADWVQAGLRPDLTILLDIPPPMGLARARRDVTADRIESEDLDFFARIRETYLALARRDAARFRIIDAKPPAATVHAQVLAQIEAHFALTDPRPSLDMDLDGPPVRSS